ncbi:MAG TPA: glycoside hydrolase family 44 protein [Anaerolineaceae bacterium]|nr:glycoside hydrolase family 44 protein [Anaerolineaceae bacterium]
MTKIYLAVGLCAALLLCCLAPVPVQAAEDLVVYDETLAAGWQDWSWGAEIDLANGEPVHTGTYSAAVTLTGSNWGALYLGRNTPLSTSGYSGIRFWIHGGAAGGQQISFHLMDNEHRVHLTLTAGSWVAVTVPFADLGGPLELSSLVWQDDLNTAQPTFYVDGVVLIGDDSTPTPTPPPGVGPGLSVDAAVGRHPISREIYGMNFAAEDLASELRLPVRRWGGNATTRYNWAADISNQASDWYFENYRADPAQPRLTRFLEQDLNTHTRSIVTLPLIGWVPNGDPSACGFSIEKYGPQQDADWSWRPDCGNGVGLDGQPITGNDPRDTSDPIGPEFVGGWVTQLVTTYGRGDQGGILYYNLDNEPMLWSSTHRDVHPEPTSYDEMRDRTWAYAAAIKAADPSARTLGPVTWGWTAYFWSARDWADPDFPTVTPDRSAHGGLDFTAWYLQQMQAYEQAQGVRLLDYLDLHYYPQASGVSLAPAGNAATQALRLRSTRSLWDETYADESWIADVPEGPQVRLIPRMHDWVETWYPGTRLAITEYNWGALDHINGALAQADVLGIFGREGVDLAALWGPPESDDPGAFAFRMYLNYDGQRHTFGETSIQSLSSDQDRLSIYAAQRGADGALTLMIINKTATDLVSPVSLAHFAPAALAQVYRYSALVPDQIVRQADQPVADTGFTATFPANSITLVVVSPALAPQQTFLPAILKGAPRGAQRLKSPTP